MPDETHEPLAAIDIGSNSVRLLIKQGETVLARELAITRLGKGMGAGARIGASGKDLGPTQHALRHYRSLMQDHGVRHYRAIGTAALREHPDRHEVVAALEGAGLSIEIISAQEEAELAYEGASLERSGPVWVVDIGGGSTELVTRRNDALAAMSTALGSVRLKEMFLKNDPTTPQEVGQLQAHIAKVLLEQSRQHLPHPLPLLPLVGVAGTVTTLCQMLKELVVFDPDEIHGVAMTRQQIQALFDKLNTMPVWERSTLPGLPPERADVINAGAAILLGVMDLLAVDSVEVSCQDNLDAVLHRLAKGETR